MNLLEKAIGVISPSWGMNREISRRKLALLATYAAADRGRQNRDRNFSTGSADLAILPDQRTLLAFSRQLCRDNWIAKSIIRAARRNIVGSGIQPVPTAKGMDGKPLTEFNRVAKKLFHVWADSAQHCDVERRQNLWQKQRMLVSERYAVGEGFIVWSYQPPMTANGQIDKTKPVGLRYQSFESEMLDLTKQWYESNEVRGGVELNADGAPVAYHFWTRNPNDYLFRRQMHSVRIPADRVFHYYDQERVLQTRAEPPMASVMNTVNQFGSCQDAVVMKARMEACSGAVIKTGVPASSGGIGLMPVPSDTGKTDSGMQKFDWVPGMTWNIGQNEEVTFTPNQTPSPNYESFSAVSLRGIGAGVGMSYGLLARHFDSSYSAARQDMLEDMREFEGEQDLLIHTFLDPLYEIFVTFAIAEGRFDALDGWDLDEYLHADPHRFLECTHITPAKPWIDPEKEFNAYSIALANHLTTRDEIITQTQGGQGRETMMRKAEEDRWCEQQGLALPEKSGAPSSFAKPDDPAVPPTKKSAAMSAVSKPPRYSLSVLPAIKCDTCSFIDIKGNPDAQKRQSNTDDASSRYCRKYRVEVAPDALCGSWECVQIDAITNDGRGRTLPPYRADGQPTLQRDFMNPMRPPT